MLNLVGGTSAIIESPTHAFESFIVHYAETFIVPSIVKEYTVRPEQGQETIQFIKAYVRQR